MLIVLVASLAAPADAGELVLYTGDQAAATAALAVVYPDRDAAEYDFKTITQWLDGKPITLTAGAFEVCNKPPARPWKEALTAALKPIDEDLDFKTAGPLLEEARAAMVCSTEPIDTAAAAKIEYLRGVAAHFAKDTDASAAAFTRALTIDPTLVWDKAYPPSAKARFEDSKKAVLTTKTSVAIVPRNVPVRVDGRPVEMVDGKIDVGDGTHILQVGDAHPVTLRVTFKGEGAASLAVPGAVPEDATSWVADPLLAGDLARLTSLYTPGVSQLVVSGTDVYSGGNGALAYAKVLPPVKKGGDVVSYALMGTGGTLFAGGGVLAFVALGMGNHAVEEGDAAADFEAWEAAEAKYNGARGLVTTGWAVAGIGVALAGAGGALFASDVSVGPMIVPGGGGLVVRVGGGK